MKIDWLTIFTVVWMLLVYAGLAAIHGPRTWDDILGYASIYLVTTIFWNWAVGVIERRTAKREVAP